MTDDRTPEPTERMRALPSVDRITAALEDRAPQPVLTDVARRAVDEARDEIRSGRVDPRFDDILARAVVLLEEFERTLLQPVVNATGVLLHTNLGRVPLGRAQLDAVAAVSGGYSNLEFDLETGKRGSRYSHAIGLLSKLTGAESALVVNNNAAAVLVVLASLCAPREVIISRGELIEIGGEFRIPDVMSASGAKLVEVGTTNRTHLADYEKAIGPETAAILKVHPSNYKVVGFTASVDARSLGRLARGRGLLFLHDLGSGLLGAADGASWLREEPPVDAVLQQGTDVVTFSGDKLLGGPQAGIIVGRRDCIDRIARHPLMRAVRVDKMTLAALEATLLSYLRGRRDDLPLWQMAAASFDRLRARAQRIAVSVADELGDMGLKAEAVRSHAVTGGGSLPATDIVSWAVALSHPEFGADELERRLRSVRPPVIGRIEDDRLLLDVRTVLDHQDELLRSLVVRALR